MGGAYYREPSPPPQPRWKVKLEEACAQNNRRAFVESYRSYVSMNGMESGYIGAVAKALNCNDGKFPREFEGLEYEVKFNIVLDGKEPEGFSTLDYLNVYEFPAVASSRFLKDPLNTTSVGHNKYYGTDEEERLVIIEKMGRLFTKQKSEYLPLEANLSHKDIITKRREQVRAATPSEVVKLTENVMQEHGVAYRGILDKERADMFVLDITDGRIYNFTVSRATIARDGERNDVQRQLEIEYAGFLPKFRDFKKENELQLMRGMVDLARYTYALYNDVTLPGNARMRLVPTKERKYDFVLGTAALLGPGKSLMCAVELLNGYALPGKGTDITILEAEQSLK